jgi:anti-sigma regulatory factor (Ser/Thr protein kinase)
MTGFRREHDLVGDDFARAGRVSTEVKALLKRVGYSDPTVRRVAIAVYEAEMNVVMYARWAHLVVDLEPEAVHVEVEDVGPGIPDVTLAMREGYSTATDRMRQLGFGAGMGLPNIQRNTDELSVESEVGRGTRVRFTVREEPGP